VKTTPARSRLGRTFITRSAGETQAAAEALARGFEGNEVVFLVGELGAGKTVFAKGLAAGLGLENVDRVCSPTFTIMNVYPARVPVYHFDLYRLGKGAEVRDLGFEDYIGEGVVIVEWAERMADAYPAIEVTIEVGSDDRRTIRIRNIHRRNRPPRGKIRALDSRKRRSGKSRLQSRQKSGRNGRKEKKR
jgi:tRNA threonylcarbamoyladenosine biosynthesis protein TsaE